MKYTIYILLLLFTFNTYAQEFKKSDPKDMALFPQRNEIRDVRKISGIWKFKKDTDNKGIEEKWFNGLEKYRQIAVPGSWNEQFTDMREYRDWAWYETEMFIPSAWKGERIFIRIGEASYAAKVWINGKAVGMHEGAHLPFAFDISSFVKWDTKNRLSIQVENIYKDDRMPSGAFSSTNISDYDYFPYAGLNRDVWVYAVPAEAYVKDITVKPSFKGKKGVLDVTIEKEGRISGGKIIITGNGGQVEKRIKFSDNLANISIEIPDVRLWSPDDPYLYEVKVILGDKKNTIDMYSLKTGVRTVSVDKNHILLNGKPVFLKGFGKHEDFPIYGGGINYPVLVADFELMKWTGANSFRTSNYPYDEEYYNMADREGIMIIGETPAVGMFTTNDTTQLLKNEARCKQYLQEMILRDKNHPSVIMWSLANEPTEKGRRPEGDISKEYAYKMFADYMQTAKELDPTRLVMYMGSFTSPSEWFDLADVVCINRFYGWYQENGRIGSGVKLFSKELDELHAKYNKPIMVTEFGAGAIAGMHAVQPEMFTEEYQVELIKAYLDEAKTKDFVTGMHVWNFADFKTNQSIIRLGGYNLKGVFTRDRRPKAAAHYLRSVWKK
ncbi:MAG: beta-glucuronidase [Labilibaculum sp.]|nr:beta-glucuronidase [Labilibaculum sp.]